MMTTGTQQSESMIYLFLLDNLSIGSLIYLFIFFLVLARSEDCQVAFFLPGQTGEEVTKWLQALAYFEEQKQ